MASDSYVNLCFYAASLFFGAFAFCTSIAAAALDDWERSFGIYNTNSGLWKTCISDSPISLIPNGCQNIGDVPPWFQAVRAFIVLMIIFTFFGSLVHSTSLWKMNKKARLGSGIIFFISGLLGLTAGSIYARTKNDLLDLYSDALSIVNIGVNYGSGFILCWFSAAILFLAGISNLLSLRYMQTESST